MRLYLARHGESLGNVKNVLHGQTDFPLTDEGRAQAKRLAVRLSGLPIDRVVSSPLKRAAETAMIVSSLPIGYDDRLKEQNMGAWENVTFEAAEVADKARLDAMMADWTDDNAAPPEGECFSQLLVRVGQALDGIIADGRDTLVVSHAGVMTAALVHLLGMDRREAKAVRFEKGGFIAFEIQNGQIRLLSHLDRAEEGGKGAMA